MTKSKAAGAAKKQRGGWLTAWLILMILHSAFATYLIMDLRKQQMGSVPLVLSILIVLNLADIVSAVAVWNWRKWGFTLYGISTLISIVLGLILTGTQLVVFHDIIPFAILGYLLRRKWQYFD
jgi:hypothetical protein